MSDKKLYKPLTASEKKLVAFVTEHTDLWREHRNQNYLTKWEEYERLWRGIWSDTDKNRESERSRIISPAIRQAIDSHQAEIEEAVFGRKDWFDIEDSADPKEQDNITKIKKNLIDDFKKDKIKRSITQVNQLAEVYGTGIGELMLKKTKETVPAVESLGFDGLQAVGVREQDRVAVLLKPVSCKNFMIDPNALDIEDAMGVAIEEFVSIHVIIQGMTSGIYRTCNLQTAPSDPDMEPVQQDFDFDKNRIKVLRYYGLVPKELLLGTEGDNKDKVEDAVEAANEAENGTEALDVSLEENYGDMIEAIIVLADGGHLLKAEENPYMMKDRPLIVYRPEIITGRFWGCGTVEKGYNMQKALDSQLRAHMDATALATAPMMGLDATRMPRGFKFEIRPGKSVLTNGDPKEVLFPFNFGQVNPVSVQTSQLFERYLQQATGTLDSSGLPQQVGNQADTGGMAMALSGIIKKHKRALINFQEDFLIPFIWKAAVRRMQFDPDRYPVKDYSFIPTSTLGIMAREYEQQQFVALLQTLGPQSPIVPLILKGIIENSSLSSREELVTALAKMSQPDPQAQQAAQQQQQVQMGLIMAQTEDHKAKAAKSQAEAQAVPLEVQAKMASAMSQNISTPEGPGEFEKRAKIMELALKKADLGIKARDSENNLKIAGLQHDAHIKTLQTKVHETHVKDKTARIKIERDSEGNLTSLSRESA